VLLIDQLRDAWVQEPPDDRSALVTIALIGVALRAIYLTQPMRYDEAVTYMYFVRLDWADALSTYTYPNNHLFHTALAKAAASVFGAGPAVLRLPAFLAGAALPVATYVMVRLLYDGRAALMASALIATSGTLVMYSANARGYTIVALAFTLLVIQAVRLMRGAPPHEWIAFAVIATLGLWAIPVMLYPLGAVVAWYILNAWVDGRTPELRRLWIALGITAIATAALYAPVIAREGLAAVTRNRFVAPMGWYAFLGDLPRTWYQALSSWTLGVPPLFSAVLLMAAAVALLRHRLVARQSVGLPLATFVWCCWLLVVNHRAPFPRAWLWLLPLMAGLASSGVLVATQAFTTVRSWLETRMPAVSIALAVGIGLSVAMSRAVARTTDTGTYLDAAAAVARLSKELRPGDRILASIPSNAPLMYYMHRAGIDLSHLALDERRAHRIIAVVDGTEGQRLDEVIARSLARDTTVFGRPEILARFPASALVIFRRRDVPAT
jgi:4-amino-4-deoxy-L-arabinose transferase-like glycosyltransferase